MGKKRAVSVGPTSSVIIPQRRFVDVDLSFEGNLDEVLDLDLSGAVVRVRISVPSEQRARWEDGFSERLDEALEAAHHAYPPEVSFLRTDEESERRVIVAKDPESAFREYVEGLRVDEADREIVIAEGVEVLQECGL